MWKQLDSTLADGTKIYIIDGTEVRREIDDDFIMGGNGFAYDYVPQDEIWLEKLLDQNERFFIFIHERIESQLMKLYGYDYDAAHMAASGVELAARRHEIVPSGAPQNTTAIQLEFFKHLESILLPSPDK